MAKTSLETAVLDAELRTAGHVVRPLPRRGARPGARPGSRSGSWTAIAELLDARRRATSTRATCGSSSRSSPAGTSSRCARCASGSATTCCCRSTRTPRTRWPTRATWPGSTPFDLLLIEQPLPEDDILGHADPGRGRSARPICLDESITSARAAADAIAPGRLLGRSTSSRRGSAATSRRGGSTTCAEANGIPVWCGGMLETGIGRAANVALAALPGFTLPGDTSASDRYFATDITAPFVLEDGHLARPDRAGHRRRRPPRRARRRHPQHHHDSTLTRPVRAPPKEKDT